MKWLRNHWKDVTFESSIAGLGITAIVLTPATPLYIIGISTFAGLIQGIKNLISTKREAEISEKLDVVILELKQITQLLELLVKIIFISILGFIIVAILPDITQILFRILSIILIILIVVLFYIFFVGIGEIENAHKYKTEKMKRSRYE